MFSSARVNSLDEMVSPCRTLLLTGMGLVFVSLYSCTVSVVFLLMLNSVMYLELIL